MYVTALIDIGNQLTPAVPVDAVVRSEGKDYIFMISEPERETVKDENDKKNTGTNFSFQKSGSSYRCFRIRIYPNHFG